MSRRIYGRLAAANIKNNRKTYIPYILACALTVMMYFIMDGLALNEGVGEGKIAAILDFASYVIMVFAVIFLFYTNSFLIKRRKKEIGIYNILGMGKGHIARMLILETLGVSCVSIGAGVTAGMVFSKLMWLLLIRLLNYEVRMEYMIPAQTLLKTIVLFGVIFAMTLSYNLMQVKLANPAELLRGGNEGEREPKTKLLLALAGVALIGYGYYIALTVPSPLAALERFLAAVIVVILGTYALFIAGSIAFLKLLRKNRKYYYQSRHFVAVSGMLYRMKQNAAGLASICILSTMVLVLVSASVCLYLGVEDMLQVRYPEENSLTLYRPGKEDEEKIEKIIGQAEERHGVKASKMTRTHYGAVTAIKDGKKFHLRAEGDYSDSDICEIYMIPQEDYNQMTGENAGLSEDEVMFYTTKEKLYGWDTLAIEDKTYHIKKELEDMWAEHKSHSRLTEGIYIIFDRKETVQEWLDGIRNASDLDQEWLDGLRQIKYRVTFDLEGDRKAAAAAAEEISKNARDTVEMVQFENRDLARDGFYGTYGGLFFIGIYLGAMFLMATVLIIYYKQISEGYDDRERYQIMQKVGMDQREVKRTIRSQVLTVFFLPLIMAVIHISVAFTVVKELLALFYLVNSTLFFWCTAATIAIFAVFYVIVYSMTAREYYRIVG